MSDKVRLGFDTKKYLTAQKKAIEKRLSKFKGRLYLEFGGKLIEDYHAVRTLPGYEANAKLELLKSLKKNLGIIYCISAKQLSDGKVRGDFGVGYGLATIKALEDLQKHELPIIGVVINRYEGESEAIILERKLKNLGIKVYKRKEIPGYPNNLDLILSEKGYGKDEYIKTNKQLVIVWGAGPGAGKLSTCLGQIYLDQKHGMNSGYAKFETFPVWDLPLNHPINVAYEAATADLGDYNVVDKFHLKAHKKIAINYNRDIDAFPIIKATFEKFLSKNNYSRNYESPTDMGFNVLKQGMINDVVLRKAAKKEISFYLFRYRSEFREGLIHKEVLDRIEAILKKAKIKEDYLPPVKLARKKGAAIELDDGKIVTGKKSDLLCASAAMILNSLKTLANIDDDYKLISPLIIEQIHHLKNEMGDESKRLSCADVLLALAVSINDNPLAEKALKYLGQLKNCFMHTKESLLIVDQDLFRKLQVWVSTDGEK